MIALLYVNIVTLGWTWKFSYMSKLQNSIFVQTQLWRLALVLFRINSFASFIAYLSTYCNSEYNPAHPENRGFLEFKKRAFATLCAIQKQI